MAEPITQLPTLRQLAYLVALQDHQHFGRAAAACAVTQSALSSGLAELERLLDVRLIERTKRSLRFTDVGDDVAERARSVIAAASDLAEAAQAAREPLSAPVRMAIIPTIAPFVLPQLLETTAKRWPRLRLLVREMLTAAACEALHRNSVDCVLLALPALCGDGVVRELFEDELLLAMREGGSREADDRSDPSDLLLLDEGHCLREHALTACRSAEPPPDAPLVAATLDTLVRLVDAGLGVTFLPQMAVDAGLLSGTRVNARPTQARTVRKVALVWRKISPRYADLDLLAETIRQMRAPPFPEDACEH